MHEAAKTFILFGMIFISIGVVLYFAGRVPWLGKLPGDIMIKKENFTFYFPLTTCLLISALLSLVFYFFTHK